MNNVAGASLGQRVRRLRRAREWSLQELGQRCGLSTSTLSKLENNLVALTYDKIMRVSEALGVNISEMLVEPAAPDPTQAVTARRSLARQGDGDILFAQNYEYRYLNTDLSRKEMVPILVKVQARTLDEFGPLLRHAGEEFTFVVSGKVEVHTEYYGPTVLEAGEAIYIDSTMAHAYINLGAEPALILSVCTHGIPTSSGMLSREPIRLDQGAGQQATLKQSQKRSKAGQTDTKPRPLVKGGAKTRKKATV